MANNPSNDPKNDPSNNSANELLWQCETHFCLSLHEVTEVFGISKATLIEMLDEGVMVGQPDTTHEWLFDNEAMSSIYTAIRLHHDLGINYAGASLALELLKKIERLEALMSTDPNHP